MDIAITFGVILLIFFGMKMLIQRRTQKSKGNEIDVSILDDETRSLLTKEKSILYFYTQTCHACKTQVPIIDKLSEETKLVQKIDLSKNMALAKEFGIMGTPTIALMKKNIVTEIFVGFKRENFLRTYFNNL
ncbi:MAG: thioredoxin family protein [Melioribacteraceae bacterium]|nr:thioredoxin family protein [Melioribacteraceae bacterium]